MTEASNQHQELREALNFIADRLPPMGMTSAPEEPTKPAEANALHDAKRRAYRALSSLEEQLEALREAAAKTLHEYDLWAEDANDGEFAIWSRDEFMASFLGLRKALNPASEPKE